MGTVFAIIAGLAAGALTFVPLFAGLKLSRRFTQGTVLSQVGICLIGLIVSFIVGAGAAGVCIAVARPFCLPFVLAEAVSLAVVAICYGITRMRGI